GLVAYRHPALLEWIRGERPRLVHAVLTLASAWIAAGRPAGSRTMASYEDWARVLGGVLEIAGVGGFLDNLDELYQQADVDGDEARRFGPAGWERSHADTKTPAELFTLANSDDVALALSGQTEHARRCAFGRFLDRHRGRPWATGDGLNVTITKAKTGGR